MRIGIFGGTFNPVHIGHLRSAEEVRENFNLDKIFFITSHNPPHKNENIIPYHIRKRLITIAIENSSYFERIDIEEEIEGKSYTYMTLESLRMKYKDASFFLIIGADNLKQLHSWRYPEKVLKNADIIVTNRPGYPYPEHIELVDRNPDSFHFTVITDLEISSSLIREKLISGKSVRYLVTESVFRAIIENEKEIIKNIRGTHDYS